MNLSTLRFAKGSRKTRKRVGRGPGSGLGTTAGRGTKGHKSRSGYTSSLKEGGQMPFFRRIPKFGFINPSREEYETINVGQIEAWIKKGKLTPEVSLEALAKIGVPARRRRIKVLGNGDITVAITITAHAFSESAKEKIEKAGGKVILAERTLEEAERMQKTKPLDEALLTPKKPVEEIKKAAKLARKAAAAKK
ncbi:MAG: 50S ribosomal protein L15 [Chloroherpetonaceae bacterium]|nr:50S ribosomal protein L15 [Chloroherpetonaceae bacterium]MCS7212221.1 50S ribosomal protein L15 [Chloroherpetonaceae bacterium]MDW8018972.1 50S ribosomal protein L15 [Chloroherpetonaceae bacterium]MDW8464893.1 50S ribosomal protein L15 [Chloroherpetonaceae bacterium]